MQDSVNIDTSNAHCGSEIPCLGAPSGREAEIGMSSSCCSPNDGSEETSRRPRANPLSSSLSVLAVLPGGERVRENDAMENGTSQAQVAFVSRCQTAESLPMTACRNKRKRCWPVLWWGGFGDDVDEQVSLEKETAPQSPSRVLLLSLDCAPRRFYLRGDEHEGPATAAFAHR